MFRRKLLLLSLLLRKCEAIRARLFSSNNNRTEQNSIHAMSSPSQLNYYLSSSHNNIEDSYSSPRTNTKGIEHDTTTPTTNNNSVNNPQQQHPPENPPPVLVVTHRHTGTNTNEGQDIVVGLLIGSILILALALLVLVGPPLVRYIRSKLPVSQRRINRRYETIERWLITKVW